MEMSKIKDYAKSFLNTIFPVKCVCCKTISKDTNILCDNCMNELIKDAMQKCRKCGHLPYLCKCKQIRNIEDVVTPFFYVGENLKIAIYAVKKANLYYINEFFAKGMYNSVKSSDRIKIDEIDFITFIPRMKKSIRKYGYNQTEVLAELISEYSGIPYESILNASRLYKREQKTLSSRDERALNVKDKFIIKNNKKTDIENKTILIIDDIVTSGSTLSECARVLKNSGANKVYALCAATVFSKYNN